MNALPTGVKEEARRAFRRSVRSVPIDMGSRFPWRAHRDPYRLLIAEVLLQRTRGPNVAAHFSRIASTFPTPRTLGEANVDRIASAIAPLGLKKRAAILKRLGEELVAKHSGLVPVELDELLALPGVGPYAANAVRCFAFGKRAPIVDSGVARILRRCFDLPSDRRVNADATLWSVAADLLPRADVTRHNFALLTIAQESCLTKPKCEACVLNGLCRFARHGGDR